MANDASNDGGSWWATADTRSEALTDAQYYMWYGNTKKAYAIIVALCESHLKKGTEKYDENLESRYVTKYQK